MKWILTFEKFDSKDILKGGSPPPIKKMKGGKPLTPKQKTKGQVIKLPNWNQY